MFDQSSEMVVVADQPVTSESFLAFGTVWSVFEESIRRFARIITPDDDDQNDLIQEAMITLWKCEPARWDFHDRADASYVRRMLINRMWDVWGGDRGRVGSKEETEDSETREAARRPGEWRAHSRSRRRASSSRLLPIAWPDTSAFSCHFTP